MAIALKKAGYTAFQIFEKAHDLVGACRHNRYPGCALVSLVRAESRRVAQTFASREIWRYMKDCASKYAITPQMRFDAAVAAAAFDETAESWRLHLKGGTTVTAPAVVSGVGAWVRSGQSGDQGKRFIPGTSVSLLPMR